MSYCYRLLGLLLGSILLTGCNSSSSDAEAPVVNPPEPVVEQNWELQGATLLDVNNDNLSDLVLQYHSDEKVRLTWRENLGFADFETEKEIDNSIEGNIYSIQMANLDGNNTRDMVVVLPTSVLVYSDVAGATTTEPSSISQQWQIETADAFASVTQFEQSSAVMLPDATSDLTLSAFAFADVSGNGLDDAIWLASGYTQDKLYVYRLYYAVNEGQNKFTQPVVMNSGFGEAGTGKSVKLLASGDINGDGIVDLPYIEYLSNDFFTEFSLRWDTSHNAAEGSLLASHVLPFSIQDPDGAMTLDWDQDGLLDFFVTFDASESDPLTGYFVRNEGVEGFASHTEFFNQVKVCDELIDLDDDGFKDLITYDGNSIFWQRKLDRDVEALEKVLEFKGNILGFGNLNDDRLIDFVSYEQGLVYLYKGLSPLEYEVVELTP